MHLQRRQYLSSEFRAAQSHHVIRGDDDCPSFRADRVRDSSQHVIKFCRVQLRPSFPASLDAVALHLACLGPLPSPPSIQDMQLKNAEAAYVVFFLYCFFGVAA